MEMSYAHICSLPSLNNGLLDYELYCFKVSHTIGIQFSIIPISTCRLEFRDSRSRPRFYYDPNSGNFSHIIKNGYSFYKTKAEADLSFKQAIKESINYVEESIKDHERCLTLLKGY